METDTHIFYQCDCPLISGMPMLGMLVLSETRAFPHHRHCVMKRHCLCVACTGASCPGATFGFGAVELHEVPVGLFLQPVQVPLNSSTALESPLQFGVICKVKKSALHFLQSSEKQVKQDQFQDRLTWYSDTRLQLDYSLLSTTL